MAEDRAVLLGAQSGRRLCAFDFLGADDLPFLDQAREQLRPGEETPVVEALPRQRAEDLTVGIEDRAVRVPEGTRFDLSGAQDDDSVCGVAVSVSSSGLRMWRKTSMRRQ